MDEHLNINHEKPDLWDALGLTTEEQDQLADVCANTIKKGTFTKGFNQSRSIIELITETKKVLGIEGELTMNEIKLAYASYIFGIGKARLEAIIKSPEGLMGAFKSFLDDKGLV